MLLRTGIAVVLLGGLLGSASLAVAAGKPAKGAAGEAKKPAGKGDRVRFSATIDALESGQIKVTTKAGEKLTLATGKKGHLRVTGSVEPSALKPGTYVQFSALVDKKSRRIKEPVSKLLVYTPTEALRPGLIPDPSPAAAAAAADSADLSVDWKPYIVSGVLGALEGRKLVMNVPNFAPRLAVDLAETLKVDFDIDDLSVVQPGDTIQVSKGQQSGDHVSITDATIKHREPLTAGVKKSPAPSPRGTAKDKK